MKLPPELLATLEQRPGELAGFLVAADWLTARGDPWGELISAQCRLEGATDPSVFLTFQKQAAALLLAHGTRWLGGEVSATWRRGFVERIELDDLASFPRVLASEIGGLAREYSLRGTPPELKQALRELCDAAPQRLEGLTLRGKGALSAPLPPLRRLEVHRLALDWTSAPSTLRELFIADAPSPSLVPWLQQAPASFERLELLELELPATTLQPLVDRQQRLRTLHLEDDLPDDVAVWLGNSPVLATLDHLALGGPLTDVGLDAVLTHFARFSRLRTLVLYGGRFGPTRRKWAYKQLAQISFEPRRPPSNWAEGRSRGRTRPDA
jgi:uncharacterized protein (TIGR02996 family)